MITLSPGDRARRRDGAIGIIEQTDPLGLVGFARFERERDGMSWVERGELQLYGDGHAWSVNVPEAPQKPIGVVHHGRTPAECVVEIGGARVSAESLAEIVNSLAWYEVRSTIPEVEVGYDPAWSEAGG